MKQRASMGGRAVPVLAGRPAAIACVAGAMPAIGAGVSAQSGGNYAGHILRSERDAFRAYCTTGEGARAFQKIKADFDREHLKFPFPPGPKT